MVIHSQQRVPGYGVTMIEDSISEEGIRLCTLQLRYPRFIHAELMTHRVFSRNARSSRAVPTSKLLLEPPFMPEFKQNKPGMQAGGDMEDANLKAAMLIWEDLAAYTQNQVRNLHNLGVHKQWANRPLEWFGWIDVLVTSTDWANFFALRIDPGAQPELHLTAKLIKEVMDENKPKLLQPGEWHLPYVDAA
jgi:thymidylate synthase ThyX